MQLFKTEGLNQEELDNLDGSITKKIVSIKEKKTPYKQKSRAWWLHRQIPPNIQRTCTNFSQTHPKDWRRENTFKDILWSHHYPYTKTKQRHYQKRLQNNIFDEYWCENCQSVGNWVQQHILKKITYHNQVEVMASSQGWFNTCKFISVNHHIKINKKPHDHLNSCRKRHSIKFNIYSWLKKIL